MTALRGDEADLFAEHHDHLVRIVRGLVVAPEALIEDACAMAWEQLLRHQPERGPTLIGWLRVVAVREARRLSSIQRRQPGLEDAVDPDTQRCAAGRNVGGRHPRDRRHRAAA